MNNVYVNWKISGAKLATRSAMRSDAFGIGFDFDITYTDEEAEEAAQEAEENGLSGPHQIEETTYADELIEVEEATGLEAMVATLLNVIANFLNWTISQIFNQAITIDDLVFNNYSETTITYFKNPSELNKNERSTIIWGMDKNDEGRGGLRETINQFYNIFRTLALMVYMILLLYMGIRIIISSTGEKKAQYKQLFMYWVIGAMILFLYPYVMKYTIELNNIFVEIIRSSVGSSNGALKRVTIKEGGYSDGDGGVVYSGVNLEDTPFSGGESSDYMTSIAAKANKSKRFAMALSYIILTWQLITLIVHYYKRVFMIGFLIVIFPLVAASYAVDKVADGKSQSFNKWNKEFILNVFIQSFHAIVYVFVCSTALTAATGDYDFILIIIGVTFLFTGEEIIKKIFSQESPAGTNQSLAKTAAKTMAVAAVGKKIVGGVTKSVVGKDSAVNRIRSGIADIRASGAQERAFDTMAQPNNANPGANLTGTQAAMQDINDRRDAALQDVEDRYTNGQIGATERDQERANIEAQARAEQARAAAIGNAVAAINNPQNRSAEELANAYALLQREMENNPDATLNTIMSDCNLSADQLQGMQNAGLQVLSMVANGVTDTVEIERNMKITLGYYLEGQDEATKTKYEEMFLANMRMYGVNRGYTRSGTMNEVSNIMDDVNELSNSFTGFDLGISAEEANNRINREIANRQNILDAAMARVATTDSDDVEKGLASDLAVLDARSDGTHSLKEQWQAMERINLEAEHSDMTRAMMEDMDTDFEVMRHTMALKVLESDEFTDEEKEEARRVADEYAANARLGLYDDEISIHDIIANRANADSMDRVVNDLNSARMASNQMEREITQEIATDILAIRNVDIYEGTLDRTTPLLEGKTKEEIHRQYRGRWGRALKRAMGYSGATKTTRELDQKAMEREQNYYRHLR